MRNLPPTTTTTRCITKRPRRKHRQPRTMGRESRTKGPTRHPARTSRTPSPSLTGLETGNPPRQRRRLVTLDDDAPAETDDVHDDGLLPLRQLRGREHRRVFVE